MYNLEGDGYEERGSVMHGLKKIVFITINNELIRLFFFFIKIISTILPPSGIAWASTSGRKSPSFIYEITQNKFFKLNDRRTVPLLPNPHNFIVTTFSDWSEGSSPLTRS